MRRLRVPAQRSLKGLKQRRGLQRLLLLRSLAKLRRTPGRLWLRRTVACWQLNQMLQGFVPRLSLVRLGLRQLPQVAMSRTLGCATWKLRLVSWRTCSGIRSRSPGQGGISKLPLLRIIGLSLRSWQRCVGERLKRPLGLEPRWEPARGLVGQVGRRLLSVPLSLTRCRRKTLGA